MTEEESSQRLQQLLRLKRHESPPPGYFREFSGGVIERIRATEAEGAVSWWRRWFPRAPKSSEGHGIAASLFPWGWNAVGFATLLTLAGGLYWGSTRVQLDADGNAPAQTGRLASSVGEDSVGAPASSGILWVGSSAHPDALWVASDSARHHSLRSSISTVDAGFRAPVTVSMSGSSPEVSSTNPLPVGLFRLPGSSAGAAEAYRVRFGDGPR